MAVLSAVKRPSIVFAAEFWFGSSGAGLAHGFRRLGWDTAEVDMRDHTVSGRSSALRLAARALRLQSVSSYNSAVLRAVEALRPSVFVTVKGLALRAATLAEIRRQGILTVNYYPDFRLDYTGLDPATFPLYDLFCTTKSFQLNYLRKKLGAERVKFIHHGYSTLVHRSLSEAMTEADYVADLLYAGNYSPYKAKWLEAIAMQMSNAQLMIVGSGWEAARPTLERCVAGHSVIGDAYARLLQKARINIALHSGPDGPQKWEDLVSTRTFEIPACKGFMLHVDNAEVRSLFDPDSEIAVFADKNEAVEKIAFYLAHPLLRADMIERAHRRCVPAYSYDARAQEIGDALATLGVAQIPVRRAGSEGTSAASIASVIEPLPMSGGRVGQQL